MKANKMNKSILSLGVAVAIFGGQALAATNDYGVDFKTVVDVSILQVTPMDFGSDLRLNVGATCSLLVAAGTAAAGYPGDVVLRVANVADDAQHANYGLTAGDCDATAPGVPGLYEITGAPGVPVKITMNSITTGAAFDFVPNGVSVTYDGATGGDVAVAVLADTQIALDTANTIESGDAVGSGTPLQGKLYLAVGGQINVKSILTAGTTYTENFTIDLTY